MDRPRPPALASRWVSTGFPLPDEAERHLLVCHRVSHSLLYQAVGVISALPARRDPPPLGRLWRSRRLVGIRPISCPARAASCPRTAPASGRPAQIGAPLPNRSPARARSRRGPLLAALPLPPQAQEQSVAVPAATIASPRLDPIIAVYVTCTPLGSWPSGSYAASCGWVRLVAVPITPRLPGSSAAHCGSLRFPSPCRPAGPAGSTRASAGPTTLPASRSSRLHPG